MGELVGVEVGFNVGLEVGLDVGLGVGQETTGISCITLYVLWHTW